MTNQIASVPTILTSNSFTRTNAAFTGWNSLANGLGTSYANGALYPFASDLTLYAQWMTVVSERIIRNYGLDGPLPLERSLARAFRVPGSAAAALEDHRQIRAAIAAADQDGARRAMRAHLVRVERELRPLLEPGGPEPAKRGVET